MLPPVRCLTCGTPLDLEPVYDRIHRARARAAGGQGPPSDENGVRVADVLRALRVRGCCATHLITALQITDYYN